LTPKPASWAKLPAGSLAPFPYSAPFQEPMHCSGKYRSGGEGNEIGPRRSPLILSDHVDFGLGLEGDLVLGQIASDLNG